MEKESEYKKSKTKEKGSESKVSELWVDHFSISQMSSFEECPYQHFLLKIAGVEPVPNAFAEAGILAHRLLAGWAKGEIPKEELSVQWIRYFPKEVTAEFPSYLASKGYKEKLFDAVLTYLENFTGFPGYEIIGAEREFESMIAGERFVGVVDLALRDKETGELTILDYKSCSLSSFKRSRDTMYRQLLLYGKYCADHFGEFPRKLRFELIKENTFDEREFDRDQFIAAIRWAEKIIQQMKEMDFSDYMSVKPEYFRCLNLCGARNECNFGKAENHKRSSAA